jgi:hypothetical protein
MDEHVLTCGALDKSISLCPVEPLHCTLLSHGTAPFAFSRRIHSPRLDVLPWRIGSTPSSQTELGRVFMLRTKPHPTEKAPSSHATLTRWREILGARRSANFDCWTQKRQPNLLAASLTVFCQRSNA